MLKFWNGAAAIIMSDNKLLMARGKGTSSWSIPSGGIEDGETAEEACIREVWEETGYRVDISKLLHIKKALIENYNVTTSYFLCKVIDGHIAYHDPDEIIEEISWKTFEDFKNIQLDYPKDREMLLSHFNNEKH
ncbi:NUDIX hydrolase [Rummeliibacillus sp. NPDC094406]|uniref:NUDIX hydrolase n=1 Tax=Rummeliibacillus sp. NPDC094406 TaxID=3364511 RepID=UPI0037FB7F4B